MKTIITRVLRGVYLLTLSALFIFPASFAHAVPIPTIYDFDETDYETLLADSFNAGSALTDFDYDINEGISDTGSIFTNSTSNIWTAQQPYEAPNTVDQEYVISGFFHNSGNTGYGGLGFSPDATSTLSDEHPVASRGVGISFHGDGGTFMSDGEILETLVWGGGDMPEGWYFMELVLTSNGDNTYDMLFEITESDADGVLGDVHTTHTVQNVRNNNLSFANAVYGQFGAFDLRFDFIDDLSITAEQIVIAPLDGEGTEESPWRLTECRVIDQDGYYVLDGDIESSGRDCFIIEAHDVEIDGDEYTITGEGSTIEQEYQAIVSYGFERITVMNLSITNFYDGIAFFEAPSGPYEIRNVNISNMVDDAIQADSVSDITIEDSTLSDVGDDGIDIGTYDFEGMGDAVYSSNITIENLTITDVDDSGIELESVSDIFIRNNTISGTVDRGIDFNTYSDEGRNSNIEIEGNTLSDIASDGIEIGLADVIVVNDNIVYSNATGIDIYEANAVTVTDNSISPNITDAFLIPTTEFDFIALDIESASTTDEGVEMITDYGDYVLRGADDHHIGYDLPFTFNYFGRDITSINVTTDGLIELLEDGEFCGGGSTIGEEVYHECEERGTYREVMRGDVIYASYDDLMQASTENDYMAIFNIDDEYVVIEWFGTTYDDDSDNDYTSDDHPVHFQLVLYPDGTVDWNFNEMAFEDYNDDMFTGAYDSQTAALYYAGLAIDEEEVSYSADFSGAGVYDVTDIETVTTGIGLSSVENADVYHNTITAGMWIDSADITDVNLSNDKQGNTYYFVDGRGAWVEYDIIDTNGDGYADKGDDLPFGLEVLGESLWVGDAIDEYPGTEIVKKAKKKGGSVSNRIKNLRNMGKTEEADKLAQQFPAVANNIENSTTTSSSVLPLTAFTRNLTLGDTGSDVRELQRFLNSKGYIITNEGPGSPGNETERFGELTRAALIKFQQDNNLQPAIGYFGPLTRALIASMSASTPTPTPTASDAATPVRDLELGMSGDDVIKLQGYLIAQDLGPAARALKANGVTGYFGELTKAAVIEFQQAKGITPTNGRVGPMTRGVTGV